MNTKAVFFCKAPALVEAKRALPLFVIQLQLAETAIFHSFTGTQRTCSYSRVPISPFLNARFHFTDPAAVARSSSRFTFQLEHKDRVQVETFQRLSDLNGHFRFFRSSCSAQPLDRFTLQNEHKDRVLFVRLQRLSRLNGRFRFS